VRTLFISALEASSRLGICARMSEDDKEAILMEELAWMEMIARGFDCDGSRSASPKLSC